MTRSGACSDFPINVTSTWLSASSAEASERAAEYPQPTITRFCRNRRERCGQCGDRPGVLDDQPLPPRPAEDSATARRGEEPWPTPWRICSVCCTRAARPKLTRSPRLAGASNTGSRPWGSRSTVLRVPAPRVGRSPTQAYDIRRFLAWLCLAPPLNEKGFIT
jgi:hypothetical protein